MNKIYMALIIRPIAYKKAAFKVTSFHCLRYFHVLKMGKVTAFFNKTVQHTARTVYIYYHRTQLVNIKSG